MTVTGVKANQTGVIKMNPNSFRFLRNSIEGPVAQPDPQQLPPPPRRENNNHQQQNNHQQNKTTTINITTVTIDRAHVQAAIVIID